MRAWVVAMGEPLPLGGPDRKLRAGTIADYLVRQGHHVDWWSCTFDHASKRFLMPGDQDIAVSKQLRLRLLRAPAYESNVCLRRIWNHAVHGVRFFRAARHETPPDLIYCSWPTIELSAACVALGQRWNVPVVLDIRDLWPDIFVDVAPRSVKPVARLAVAPFQSLAHRTLRGATALTGVSQAYLDWALAGAGRARGPLDAVFPHGYEKPDSSPAELEAAGQSLAAKGVDPGKVICWFVGTLGNTYDLGPVLHCARKLAAEGSGHVQFVISGDGPRRAHWEQSASDLPNVVFTGWIQKPEIAWLMSKTAVGLAAYIAGAPQGLPFKIFEYMAAGLPILSSLGGETRALLNDFSAGFSYDAAEPETCLVQLRKLLADPALRRTLGDNGARVYEDRYGADRVYGAMAGWLESLTLARPAALAS